MTEWGNLLISIDKQYRLVNAGGSWFADLALRNTDNHARNTAVQRTVEGCERFIFVRKGVVTQAEDLAALVRAERVRGYLGALAPAL